MTDLTHERGKKDLGPLRVRRVFLSQFHLLCLKILPLSLAIFFVYSPSRDQFTARFSSWLSSAGTNIMSQDGCDCYACRNFSKAYLYHLFEVSTCCWRRITESQYVCYLHSKLQTHELLGGTLLENHNTFTYSKFFEVTIFSDESDQTIQALKLWLVLDCTKTYWRWNVLGVFAEHQDALGSSVTCRRCHARWSSRATISRGHSIVWEFEGSFGGWDIDGRETANSLVGFASARKCFGKKGSPINKISTAGTK